MIFPLHRSRPNPWLDNPEPESCAVGPEQKKKKSGGKKEDIGQIAKTKTNTKREKRKQANKLLPRQLNDKNKSKPTETKKQTKLKKIREQRI